MTPMLRYRGGEGQLSWILHRLTGIGIFVYLILHVVDVFAISFGPETFNKLMAFYHQAPARILMLVLITGLVYHALNGLRIILVDFWPEGTRYQRQLFWVTLVLTVVLLLPWAVRLLRPLFMG